MAKLWIKFTISRENSKVCQLNTLCAKGLFVCNTV